MSSRNCVPKQAVLKYNTCIENDRLKMIGALDEKHFHQNDRSKMIVGGNFCFQQNDCRNDRRRENRKLEKLSHQNDRLQNDRLEAKSILKARK